MRNIQLPVDDGTIRQLQVGEPVQLNGVMVTGRDAAHKWLTETFIHKTREPDDAERQAHIDIARLLHGSVIYHCGPVVSTDASGAYHFKAAGPTTSIREEPYQADVMRHFNLKGIVGKGGMGAQTLKACQETPGVYFHAIGGAASFIAQSVKKVLGVHKLEFGTPEALWVIQVEAFPAVVTMDAHGGSQHQAVHAASRKELERLLAQPY